MKPELDINDNAIQSRIRTILSSVQFDCMSCNFNTRCTYKNILEKVDNLTEWQESRLKRMLSEMLELEQLLIRTGVIK